MKASVFRILPALTLALICSLAGLGPAFARDQAPAPASTTGYDYYAIGDLQARTPGKVEPGLMLMGGGEWSTEAFRWLADKAGNGHLVILRASGTDDAQKEFYQDIGGVVSVQTLVFHERAPASNPQALEILRKADGIFIAGGDQSNYVRYWKGTPLNEVLNQHVRDGKPLGGTSAGLAIMGAWSYGAMDGGSLTSEDALHDPLGPGVTLVNDFLALPLLPAHRVITDSHFGKRDRLGRLVTFVARIAHEQASSEIIGLGVDENTALCIGADQVGRVYTGSGGKVWLVVPQALVDLKANGTSGEYRQFMKGRIQAGQALDFPGFTITGIGAQSRLLLPAFVVENPAFRSRADALNGRLVVRPLD